jgi:ribosomal protein L11 methylase PrmA
MYFGGLSEKEVNKICDLLTRENVAFSVVEDNQIHKYNQLSMKNNLRHLNPPSISTHVLAIVVEDNFFQIISDQLKSELVSFGITDQVPPEFELTDEQSWQADAHENIHANLVNGNKRVIAFNLKHQLILLVIIGVITYLYQKQ